MKEILLTKGLVAKVDNDDFDYLNQWKWFAHKGTKNSSYYAGRRTLVSEGLNGKMIRMHNQIMQANGIDHIDGNGLNNQRHNLRLANKAENQYNSKKPSKNNKGNKPTSIYKGVSWDSKKQKWRPRIKKHGKLYSFGYFSNESDAARAYDLKAKELFGEFAKLNFP